MEDLISKEANGIPEESTPAHNRHPPVDTQTQACVHELLKLCLRIFMSEDNNNNLYHKKSTIVCILVTFLLIIIYFVIKMHGNFKWKMN